jgi:hypothetical protein
LSTDSWLAAATQQLDGLKQLTDQIGLRFVELPAHSMGVGFGVAFGGTEYAIVSVLSQNERHAFISAGVLQDVSRAHRLDILEFCNTIVQEGAGTPIFLHDAEAGWDLIAQVTVPTQVLFDVPPYYGALLRGVASFAQQARMRLAEAGITGQTYRWDNVDSERLLSRSLV